MNYGVLISIVVPTLNSTRTIERCLSSIKRQDYPKIEIIVVDNHSTDGTREIARQYGEVYIKGPERSSQRNFGARKARGDYLCFVDSDMELSAAVISECAREVLTKDIDAVIIPEVSVGNGFWARCKALERSCYLNSSIEAARFFKKEVFLRLGGYDESLIAAEDWDLSQRVKNAGFSFSRINAFIKHEEGKLTLGKTLMKKYQYGLNISRYIKKHKKETKGQCLGVLLSFSRNYKKLLEDPIATAGVIVMRICEFSAMVFGLLVSRYFGNRMVPIRY